MDLTSVSCSGWPARTVRVVEGKDCSLAARPACAAARVAVFTEGFGADHSVWVMQSTAALTTHWRFRGSALDPKLILSRWNKNFARAPLRVGRVYVLHLVALWETIRWRGEVSSLERSV